MRVQVIVYSFLAALAVTGVAMIVGCSTESATENNVKITPSRIQLAKGASQQFTASGGYEYTWSLDGGTIVDEWGYLSASRGPSTVYTSTKDASTAGTFRVIHVTSTIPGSGGSTGTDTNVPTTTTSYSMTSEAFVEHAVKYETLNASPAAVSGLKYGSSQAFTASGGNGSYSWNLENDDLGEITTAQGPSTTYSSTSRATDDNTVNRLRLLSGDGQAVNIIIFHANESVSNVVTPLSVSPSTTTLGLDQSTTFTADGGDGTYTWSLSTRDYGTLTFGAANTATYLCTGLPPTNVSNVVRLSVTSGGETRQATILHNVAADSLTIDPTYAAIVEGDVQAFTASGGVPPYSWSVSSGSFGILAASANTANYECTTNKVGTVTITVRSADGQNAQALVDCN